MQEGLPGLMALDGSHGCGKHLVSCLPSSGVGGKGELLNIQNNLRLQKFGIGSPLRATQK